MSLKTDNFELFKYEDSDIADLRFLHDSMDIIDKGINPFYVATQSGTNVYKVTTGLNKTVLNDGYSIKVAIPSNSTGAVSITVDSVTIPVKKPNGGAVTNFKANGVYSLTYYNSVFILASGGVDDVSFSASDLLETKSANDSNGEKVTGTMKNVGQQTATINAGGKVVIAKGYHDGTGYVQSNSMSKQLTDLGATLTSANQLVSGIKAVGKNGNLITGTATIESLGGKKFATGTLVGAGMKTYVDQLKQSVSLPYATVSGIGFKPSIFLVLYPDKFITSGYINGYLNIIESKIVTSSNVQYYKNYELTTAKNSNIIISSTNVTVPLGVFPTGPITWIAIG